LHNFVPSYSLHKSASCSRSSCQAHDTQSLLVTVSCFIHYFFRTVVLSWVTSPSALAHTSSIELYWPC
jgi:hypothetical protein